MLVVVVLIVFLRRKYVIVPVLLFTFLVPLGQQVYLLGVHWLALRIIILAGCVRLARHKFSSKSPLIAGGFNSVDQAFLVCVLCEAACMILRYMQYQALIYQFGVLIDYLGAYFLLRYLIQDREDIFRAIKCLALLSLILALFMVREQLTLQNAFGSLGGVRLTPEIRGDKIRSQAVFQHSLTAGCFAATLLPLFFLLWKNGKAKLIAGIGVVGSTVMTLTAHSSTPALAYVAGILGVCFWPVRKQMRLIRWGLVIAILAQAIVMKAPVWFVLNHIDLTGSSSGYHRAELIDEFVRHFSDWWLLGTDDAGTWGVDMWDVQNQYVNAGESGGLVAFVFFIVVIGRCYKRIGATRKLFSKRETDEWLVWFLGAALFANLAAFFGADYFDQSKLSWFLLLAMISAATVPLLTREKAAGGTRKRIGNSNGIDRRHIYA
jgi:hypothetical protein